MKRFDHWQIAYRDHEEKEFKLISNPEWAWAADPFLVEYQGKVYLFAELFLYKSERNGVIGYCEYKNGKFSEWIVTMDKHWHLSYPNVWNDNGKLYMCPETYQAEEVAIYELEEFPDKWRKTCTLLQNGRYVDSTFMNYEGRDYLFTYQLIENSGILGKLLLYEIYNDGSLDQGRCVCDDIGKARPGGKIIVHDGKIIRVSQDSRDGYGSGLVFNEIKSINPVYVENVILRIGPEDIKGSWKTVFSGIHTYNRYENIEAVDLKFATHSWAECRAQKHVRKVFTNKY